MIKKFSTLLVIAGLLSACGPTVSTEPTLDVSSIHTAAAETVMAEFTKTALAVPPTSVATATESPTRTPGATLGPTETTVTTNDPFKATPTGITCDDAVWVSDVTVQDGTEMSPGQDFVKTWKVKNSGSCIWDTGYSVIFAYGEKMNGIAEPLSSAVGPNEEVEISVRFKAPSETGQFSSTWRMANASNSPFGQNFYVLIVVR